MTEYRKQSNYVYCCIYHLILPTKYRKKIFNDGTFAFFKERMREIQDYYPDLWIKEQNHDKDHVHMMIIIPPKYSVGKIVGIIKANTSRSMKQKFEFLKKCYYGTDGIWSDGYLVSTIGLNEEIIRKYIEKQGQEDLGQTLFG